MLLMKSHPVNTFIHQTFSLLFVMGLLGTCLTPCVFAEENAIQLDPQQGQNINQAEKGCQKGKHQQREKQSGERQGFRDKMKKELNLTPEQEEKMKALKEQNKPEWDQVKAKKQALQSLKEAEGSPEEIEAMQSELKALKTKLMEKHKAEVKNILTPEQQQKMETLYAQHHKQKGSGNKIQKDHPTFSESEKQAN